MPEAIKVPRMIPVGQPLFRAGYCLGVVAGGGLAGHVAVVGDVAPGLRGVTGSPLRSPAKLKIKNAMTPKRARPARTLPIPNVHCQSFDRGRKGLVGWSCCSLWLRRDGNVARCRRFRAGVLRTDATRTPLADYQAFFSGVIRRRKADRGPGDAKGVCWRSS